MSPARALRLAVVLWVIYLGADDWMRSAISHGAVIASVVSGALLAVGLGALVLAARHERRLKAKSGAGT